LIDDEVIDMIFWVIPVDGDINLVVLLNFIFSRTFILR
jgi:hypothetical protein